MDGARVAAAGIDLFENDRSLGQAQAGTAELLGNHRRQPTLVSHGLDEGFREALFLVDLAPVLGREVATQGTHPLANGVEFFIAVVVVHHHSPGWAGPAASSWFGGRPAL
ncbi:hypothetical protein D3C79_868710 [compost metagenome]